MRLGAITTLVGVEACLTVTPARDDEQMTTP
jgi:hypothetical protein